MSENAPPTSTESAVRKPGMPVAATSALGGRNFAALTPATYVAPLPYEQRVGNAYRGLTVAFGHNPEEPDPLASAVGKIETGETTPAELAKVFVDSGGSFDDIELLRGHQRLKIDEHLPGNGGDGDQAAIHQLGQKAGLLTALHTEMLRTQAPGWDASIERKTLAEAIASDQAAAETAEAPAYEAPSYLGPKRELDPRVSQLAENPGPLSVENPNTLPESERQTVLRYAERQANLDTVQNRVVARMNGDEEYWAAEFPNVFTCNTLLRGTYDVFADHQDDRTPAQNFSGPGGRMTHVIIETDDGHAYLIQRTNDKQGAAEQEFKVTSTRDAGGQPTDRQAPSRQISTEQLKDVVVIPGMPLVLGRDPATGRGVRTAGKVVRVTAIAKSEEGRVDPGHPYLQQPERFRDAPQRFMEALRAARSQDTGAVLGPLAAGGVVRPEARP